MNIRILIRIVGSLIACLGLVLLVPAAYGLFESGSGEGPFLWTALIAVAVGLTLWLSQRNYHAELDHRTALAVVAISWVAACLFGALPFYLSGSAGWLDSLFEATSGFTSTGASIFTDVESLSKPLLLWRSLTQWLGGLGIVLFFIAILPTLGFAGVQLFRAELTGPNKDRITPRVTETARKMWLIYLAMTLLLALLLKELGGLTYFDATNHALAALATGGFSTKNTGVAYFNNPTVDYLLSIFMLLAATNFGLHFRFFRQLDWRVIFDTEFKWFLGIVFGTTLIMTACNFSQHNYPTLTESFRHSFFVLTSTITTTGFANADYTVWSPLCQFLILLAMLMGGMSGSTTGGIKCIRIVAALKQLWREFKQLIHPNAVIAIKANHRAIPDSVVSAIWSFLFLYIFVALVATALILALGLELIPAFSAVVSCLSNVGPALGDLGPTSNFAHLSAGIKTILTLCMLLGRLEMFAVLVILTPAYWRS